MAQMYWDRVSLGRNGAAAHLIVKRSAQELGSSVNEGVLDRSSIGMIGWANGRKGLPGRTYSHSGLMPDRSNETFYEWTDGPVDSPTGHLQIGLTLSVPSEMI